MAPSGRNIGATFADAPATPADRPSSDAEASAIPIIWQPEWMMTDQSLKPNRLWYQSFVDAAEEAPYISRLQHELDRAAGSGFAFTVHGLTPPDATSTR